MPTPPGPVSVSSRTAPARSRSAIAASSRSRPIVRFGGAGNARSPAAAGGGRRGGWRVERGIVREDRLVEVVQLGARLDPELLDEDLAGVPVGLQRVGLAAAAIQREHQLRVQALAPRVLAGQLLELGDQLGVAPGRQVGLDAQLQRRELQLLQPRDLGRRERRRGELRQRRPAPQRERLAQLAAARSRASGRQRLAAGGDQALEALGVELVGTHRAGGSPPAS